MADRPQTSEAYYDQYVRPFLTSLNVPNAVLAPLDFFIGALSDAQQTLDSGIEALLDTAPEPAAALPNQLVPISPTDAMREVAEAVRDAETALNEANLAIANASAEVSLVVNVGGVAGANATLNVTISPTTQNIDD